MTPEQVKELSAPFAVKDHEFTYNKMIYLTEEAITRRMDEVDPNWSFAIRMTEHRADKVVIYAALTIAGVTRERNGFDAAACSKGMPALPENEVHQREKDALTDALKRCARLFGVGRYILDIPKNGNDAVKTEKDLAQWLKAQYASNGNAAPSTPEPAPLPAHLIAWTKEQRKAWVAYLENNGWHIDQIKAALDVALILDYTGTQDDANAAIDAYAAANDTDDDGAPTPLSEAEAIRLIAYAKKAHKMNYGDLCKALGVSDLRGYTDSYDDAIDALKATVQA